MLHCTVTCRCEQKRISSHVYNTTSSRFCHSRRYVQRKSYVLFVKKYLWTKVRYILSNFPHIKRNFLVNYPNMPYIETGNLAVLTISILFDTVVLLYPSKFPLSIDEFLIFFQMYRIKKIIKMLYEIKYMIMTTFHNRHRYAQFATMCVWCTWWLYLTSS